MARLMLRSLGPDWSQAHMEKAHKKPVPERYEPSYTYPDPGPCRPTAWTMGRSWAWRRWPRCGATSGCRAGETWKAVVMGVGVAAGLAAGGWLWHRIKKARNRVYDPLLIREKVSRIAFDGELQVTAVLPATKDPGHGRKRARELLEPVAAAYRHYDHPAGARFKVGGVRAVAPDPTMLHPSGPGLFGRRSVLGVREAAALWHPPGARDETPLVERSGARVLMPSAPGVRGGAPVGQTTAGKPRPIRFPEDLLRRHHLYVARTRMGKSTLMHHIVRHKMSEKAEGRDGDAIIVVDPPRRPGGQPPPAGARVPHRQRAAHRPSRRPGSARRQPPGHPHLLRPRPHPPTRWCASPKGCGTSGGPGCSPSWSRPSRPSTRPTSTPPRPTTSSSPSWTP